jgi:sugar phosphate isomerase/epimerase
MSLDRLPISRRALLVRGVQATTGLAAMALGAHCPAAETLGLRRVAMMLGKRNAHRRAQPLESADGKRAAQIRFGLTTYQWGKDWDIPTLIANCATAGALGVELRTSDHYAHGVELEIGAERRREVQKLFTNSPVTLIGLASSEKFDWPDAEKLKQAIENTKGYLNLSRDIGGSGVRVFPNDFQKDIPHEQTIAQIAKALNVVGAYAADCGQMIRLECHGSAGDLPTIRAIMDQVTARSVRVKLNSEARNTAGEGFEHNFNLVKDFLGNTVHIHDLQDPKFPNQLQIDLLVKMGWSGWILMESSAKVADRVKALTEHRELFEQMLEKAAAA